MTDRRTTVCALLRALLVLSLTGAVARAQDDDEKRAASMEPTPYLPTDAIEAPIDPSTYLLGPGDGLVVGVWGENSIRYPITVTLEGKILLPTVGEIDVEDLTLNEAEARVARMVAEHFQNVTVTLTLQRVRYFTVPVTGQVNSPGMKALRVIDRASAAIAEVGGVKEGGSLRRITITNDGEVRARVDLVRFRVMGDLDANPVLRDGDQLHVPHANDFIWVYGAVHDAGVFEYTPQDRLGAVLAYAGGLRPEAVADTIEISRFEGEETAIRFDLVRIKDGNGDHIYVAKDSLNLVADDPDRQDIQIVASDRIFVRTRGEWRERQTANILGEVVYPGTYPIIEGQTRLLDVIDRAGGLTRDASLVQAFMIRQTVEEGSDPEYERLKRLPAESMSEDEYEYLKMREREMPGLMVINFEKLIQEQDSTQNIFLEDGDTVEFPKRKDYVSVLGMVVVPGNITWRSGLHVKEYVDLAGGYANRADQGETRVVRVNSPTWLKPSDVDSLRAGDTIWVPEKPKRNYWGIFKDALLVTTQVLAVYVVIDAALDSGN
jgi:protein involved in polysaccharide export with SLBB domain